MRLHVEGRDVGPAAPVPSLLGAIGLDRIDGGIVFTVPEGQDVHTAGVAFPLDLAFLTPTPDPGRWRVAGVVQQMPPGRWAGHVSGAEMALEAEAGAFARWGLAPGCTVDLL